MKIAIVTHAFVENDGQGRVNLEVVRALSKAGHKVVLIAARIDPNLLSLPGVLWKKVSHGPFPTNLLRNAWFSWQVARVLTELKDNVDITVANGAITSEPVDVNTVHFVHSGWATSPYYDPGKGLRGVYQRIYTWVNSRLERRAFHNAQHIVAVSEQVASEVIALGVPPLKVDIIPNGVDIVRFSPEGERASLNIPKGTVRALFVGDIVSRRKGLDTILAAMPGIENLHLIVVGRTEKSPYPEDVVTAGLTKKVTFLGFRRDIPAIMRSCDFFVFPSRYEPFGLVVLEAVSSGLPVITAQNIGAAGVLGNDVCMLLDDPSDVTTIHNLMKRLSADPNLRSQMSERGKSYAVSLTWERMAESYVTLFDEVLTQKRTNISRKFK